MEFLLSALLDFILSLVSLTVSGLQFFLFLLLSLTPFKYLQLFFWAMAVMDQILP